MLLPLCLLLPAAGGVHAQMLYGVASLGSSGIKDRLVSVDVKTGRLTELCQLSGESAALGVSSIDGRIYYVDQGKLPINVVAVTPPSAPTGATCPEVKVATPLRSYVFRATFCPDGSFYVGALAEPQIIKLDPATGMVKKSMSFNNIPMHGSGDFDCASNGDLYVLAPTLGGSVGTPYSLYRMKAADLNATPDKGYVPRIVVGKTSLSGDYAGLAEVARGSSSFTSTGCSPVLTDPCFVASFTTTSDARLVTIDASDAIARPLGPKFCNSGCNQDYVLADLGAVLPIDLSIVKTAAPAALQGQTVTYSLLVSNAGVGTAVTSGVKVVDKFDPATFSSVAWSCAVDKAGAATELATSCTAAGTGNISSPVSLSVGGSVKFSITATLASGFVGKASNVARLELSSLLFDENTDNDVSAPATTAVSPAAHLTLDKTNGTDSLVAGQTTSYTVTVANLGPGDAPGTLVRDAPGAGLSCASVSCSATAGASCPVGLSMASLTSAGQALPTFSAGSTVRFVVKCEVTASGFPQAQVP